MTLPTMKAGDRVRITVEGKIIYIASDGYVRVLYDDARHGETSFTLSELTAPTARVEVLPPPIDLDLVLAREWFRSTRIYVDVLKLDRGGFDDTDSITSYLAGLKAARAGKGRRS